MGFEELEQLTQEIKQRYDQNPKGWSIFTDNKANVVVVGPSEAYSLKLVPLSPQKYTGVGVRLEEPKSLKRIRKRIPSAGLRPLSQRDIQKLLTSIQHSREPKNELIGRILEREPMSTRTIEEIRPQALMTGPVIAHPDLGTISERQRELQRKLAYEADKLFRKRYPMRAGIYR